MADRKMLLVLTALVPAAIAPASGADMKYPDWESQWRRATAGTNGGNSWDPTKSIGIQQGAPLTPEYQAIFEAGLKRQKAGSRAMRQGRAAYYRACLR